MGYGAWASWAQVDERSYDWTGTTGFGGYGVNRNNYSTYGFHPGGANVLHCDGSVHLWSSQMDDKTHAALLSMNGSESITTSDW
jgi:prepilin-type processing-associated H-X9-DG protein